MTQFEQTDRSQLGPDHTGRAQHEIEHTVHSTKTLVKASLFAAIFGGIVITTVIMPAEYNIDPTGIGSALGLTTLSNPVQATPVMPVSASNSAEFQENSASITVPAGAGLEYKFYMNKGDALRYRWNTNGDSVFLDFHGEPKGDTTGYFESYTVATSSQMSGSLTAPFDGTHGWYWENKTSTPVEISVQIAGNYELIGIK